LIESFHDAGEEFGQPRLVEALRRNRELPLKTLMASIVDEVRRFGPHEQHDDLTLIVARHKQNQ
jgi:serine phosphatase RsbU (regulator of sigma subunit)